MGCCPKGFSPHHSVISPCPTFSLYTGWSLKLSLLKTVVSHKGRESASSVFNTLRETQVEDGQRHDQLSHSTSFENVYTDSGFISDAIECLRPVKKHGFKLPFQSCNYLMDCIMKSNTPAAAWAFYSEILDYAYPPSVYTFKMIMHSFSRIGKIKEAQVLFYDIRNRYSLCGEFQHSYNGLCKKGDLEGGFSLKILMVEEGIAPDVVTYSVLINGLSREQKIKEACDLFDEINDRGLVPNGITITTLIDGYCKGNIEEALEIYQKMMKEGLKPDLVTYNSVIYGHCKVGELKEAGKLFLEIREMGLKPDKITYTTLIDGFCEEGDIKAAMEI
ncbi:hypothetical protein AMTR_s00060p00141630 [Amborella trichopoda]|uniref:Pentacotripeptide-repeat region of PRORP domain-containing protein n=3 Tax=Amborella trichopoda TaxID=13333 RepID=W1NKW3_AMBTC|nr:hypothetical protein AMTR_s00060p00141630 [Amborella trichopoda]